jgi:hypothetical protein
MLPLPRLLPASDLERYAAFVRGSGNSWRRGVICKKATSDTIGTSPVRHKNPQV